MTTTYPTEGEHGQYWAIYVHRNDPRIRYWVEMKKSGYSPFMYLDGVGAKMVRLKSARHARWLDTQDYPPRIAPPAGLWPASALTRHYKRELEVGAIISAQRSGRQVDLPTQPEERDQESEGGDDA